LLLLLSSVVVDDVVVVVVLVDRLPRRFFFFFNNEVEEDDDEEADELIDRSMTSSTNSKDHQTDPSSSLNSLSSCFWIRDSATHNEISKFLRECPPRFLVVRKTQSATYVAMTLDAHTLTLKSHHVSDDVASDLDRLAPAVGADAPTMRAQSQLFDFYFNQFIRDALLIAIDAGDVAAVQLSVARSRAANDLEREAPLCRAAALGVLPIVQLLLNHGASVNQLNEFGVSPLWCAAAANRPDVVQLLIAHGASPLVELPADGTSPLFVAARCGASECVRLLAACPSVDVDRPRTGHFDVPLMAAVRHGHVDTVRELCRSGANVLVRCGNTSPLSTALRSDSRILFELLATGRVPQQEVDRLLALALYAMTPSATMVRVLLCAGATSQTALPVDIALDIVLCFIAAELPQSDFTAVFRKIESAAHATSAAVVFDAVLGRTPRFRSDADAAQEHWKASYEREVDRFRELATKMHWPRLRPRFTTIAIALEALGMPVDQTIAIMDASDRYAEDVPLILKWDLACAVKHFKRAA
jgi:hypothetical protein